MNPFRPMKSSGSQTGDGDIEAAEGPMWQQKGQKDGRAVGEDDGQGVTASVVTTGLTAPVTEGRANLSAPWSLQGLRSDVDMSANLSETLARHTPSSPSGSLAQGRSDDAHVPMVVARSECELSHPRPSRSSSAKLLRVLGDNEEAISDGHRHWRGQSSPGSTASFHTARQG
ncbi:hypothetical protein M406DRAFT_358417 [Cryphonectria parasitica EP155]|uniref:Uncharacterized protein n=1 Tax=Cryphonectria parasitica (strain ATCC 38755 / EP155) TaxID=660469 RepID=A0A9P4XU65_CRYP1|nr:uncharacterized protein M406DRAFT_358417 [Cryphonectria parasitica EP155]KAF3760966.1 hypothetical protein M406DRAFT_358417 [Cryphonectria parasitica EP155]